MIYKFLPLFLLSLMSFGTFATKVENKEDKNIKVITNTDPKLLAEKVKLLLKHDVNLFIVKF